MRLTDYILADDRFKFLNTFSADAHNVDWESAKMSALWRYNLHYFDYLRQSNLDPSKGLALIDNWIEKNNLVTEIGWDPYPLSLRVVNWVSFFTSVSGLSEITKRHIESLGMQATWLLKNLEYHILANHLFANIKGLLFCGGILGNSLGDKLISQGLQMLRQQVPEQFLNDGGHYERSVMYHAILTKDLIDLCNLFKSNPDTFPAADTQMLQQRAQAALDFMHKLDTPDRSVPFFNDSANGIAPNFSQLSAYAGRIFNYASQPETVGLHVDSLESSGYYIVREEDTLLIIDCGCVGPDYQPGHTHCDMLSYGVFRKREKTHY